MSPTFDATFGPGSGAPRKPDFDPANPPAGREVEAADADPRGIVGALDPRTSPLGVAVALAALYVWQNRKARKGKK